MLQLVSIEIIKVIKNMYILPKYIGEKRYDYEELTGVYNQNKLQIISIMLTHDQIWNLHHIRSSKWLFSTNIWQFNW